MLPSVFTSPASFAGDVLAECVNHPIKMLAIGFFCGLATEAVVYLAGEAYLALCAYRDAIKAA